MKKIAVLFSSLAFLFASIGISVVHAAGAATLTLSPTNTTVKTGDSFVLSVLVGPNGESLDTARLELDWDATKLEVLAVDNGSLFPNESPANSNDNTNGDLTFGVYKFGTPVTSSGTLGSVTFRALSSGSATVSVLSSSRLIADGVEKLNTGVLGTAVITVTGTAVTPEAATPAVEQAPAQVTAPVTAPVVLNAEQEALKYFGAMAGRLPSNGDEWTALKCIAYGGCQGTPQNIAREGEALRLFGEKYGSMPMTSMEWNVIHAIAYTNVFINWGDEVVPVVEETAPVAEETAPVAEETAPVEETMSDEQIALKYFGAFFGRMPASGNDWEALHCMAYGGCQGDPRDLAKEGEALKTFGAKYAKMPETTIEWNVLHTIAYTNLLLAHESAPVEEVVVPVVVEETTPTELSLDQQAVGWFGKLTGRMPSSETDWLAVNYMVNGYTPEVQDLDAEAAAISTFAGKFGSLPSSDQDWNIIAAIAYSGAF